MYSVGRRQMMLKVISMYLRMLKFEDYIFLLGYQAFPRNRINARRHKVVLSCW